MKTTALFFSLLMSAVFLAAASPPAATDSVDFIGVSVTTTGPLFALHDKTTRESSPWLKLDQTWRGYTTKSYEPKSEKLTVKRATTELTLSLLPGQVAQAAHRKPHITTGTTSVQNDLKIYSFDATIDLGRGQSVSSPTGIMVSDEHLKIIGGDLAVQMPRGVITANDATLDTEKGMLTAKTVRLTFPPKPRPRSDEPKKD